MHLCKVGRIAQERLHDDEGAFIVWGKLVYQIQSICKDMFKDEIFLECAGKALLIAYHVMSNNEPFFGR